MESTRQHKIARLIQKDLSDIFLRFARTLGGTLISVSEVRISPDLAIAHIYLSIFPQDKVAETMEKIEENKGKFRGEMGTLERHQLRHRHDRLATNTRNALNTPRHDCAHLRQRLHAATARRLQQARQHTEHTAQLIRMNNPERILSMGFSLTVCNGQRIGINDTVRPGDTLTTRLTGGRILTSTVTHTETVKTINDADTTPTHA